MKSNKYTVQTVSIIQHGSVIEEYYVGNDRNKANQILTDLQKKEFTRIQLIDKETDKLFQYDYKNSFGYNLKIFTYDNN